MKFAHLLSAAAVAVCLNGFCDSGLNTLTKLEIEGPDVVCSHMKPAFTCRASWTNLVDSVDVTGEVVWSVRGGDGFVSIGANTGVLALDEAGINENNDLIQIHVIATYGGRTEIHELEIIPTESDELATVTIVGADALGVDMTAQYACEAEWFTADSETVDPADTNLVWMFENGTSEIAGVARMSGSGLLTPDPDLVAETNILLFAVYRNNTEVIGDFEVLLTPASEIEPSALSIEGPGAVPSGESRSYSATLFWSNWAEEPLADDDPRLTWSVCSTNQPAIPATITNGVLTVGEGLTETGTVFVCAEFVQGEWSVVETNEVKIIPPLQLSRIALFGSASIVADKAGVQARFTVRGTWSNGDVRECTNDVTWVAAPEGFVSIDDKGVLTTLRGVEERTLVRLTTSVGGKTATAEVELIPPSMLTLAGLSIIGSSEVYVREGATVQYACIATYSDGSVVDRTTNGVWSLAGCSADLAAVDGGALTLKKMPEADTNAWLLAELDGMVTSNEVSILRPSVEIVGPDELTVLDRGQYRGAEVRSSSVSILIRDANVVWAADNAGFATLVTNGEGRAVLVPNRRAPFGLETDAEVALTMTYDGMTAEAFVTILPGTNPLANPDVPAMVVTGYADADFASAAGAKKIVAFAMRMDVDEDSDPVEGRAVLYASIEGTYDARKGTLSAKMTAADGKPVPFAAGQLTVRDGVATGALTGKKDPSTVLAIRITPEQVDGTLTTGAGVFEVRGGWDVFANKKDAAARAALTAYDGVYNVALPVLDKQDAEDSEGLDACPAAGGYLSVTVAAKSGKAKVSGVLGDGAKISATVPVCTLGGVREAETNGVCLPIVVQNAAKFGAFTGVLWLHREDEGVVADFNTSCCAWYAYRHHLGKKFKESDDHPYMYPCEYEAWLGGVGGRFDAGAIPENLIVTNLVDEFVVPEYYVRVAGDYETLSVQDQVYPFGLTFTYDRSKGKLSPNAKSTKPKKKSFREDGESWYECEYAGPTDSGLKLSFNKKTGVLSGGFKLWYEGEVGENSKLMLKSLSPKAYGAWVPGFGGYLFGVVSETDPELKPYALKYCLPFSLVNSP